MQQRSSFSAAYVAYRRALDPVVELVYREAALTGRSNLDADATSDNLRALVEAHGWDVDEFIRVMLFGETN